MIMISHVIIMWSLFYNLNINHSYFGVGCSIVADCDENTQEKDSQSYDHMIGYNSDYYHNH